MNAASSTLEQPAPATTAHGRSGRTVPSARGPWRARIGWAVVVVVVVLLTWLITAGQVSNTQSLDPANPGPKGAQAVAEVLRDEGVDVTVVRSQEAFLDEPVDAGTSVVVTRTPELSGTTARTAIDHAGAADRVVLLKPDNTVLHGMDLPVDATKETTSTTMTAGCDTPEARPSDQISRGAMRYEPRHDTAATVCFPPSESFSSGGSRSGYLLDLPRQGQRPPIVLLGSGAVLQNGSVTEDDNAGVALRALGHSPRLVWYVADSADIAAGDGSKPLPVLPGWAGPSLVLVAAAVLALMVWRGRRLGPLVTEPLPVVVRAVETTESRGRLYRKASDRGRALAVLRAASRRRLTAYLGLAPRAPAPEVAQALARATGRDPGEVLALLEGAAPASDEDLLQTADQLASLEEEVRR